MRCMGFTIDQNIYFIPFDILHAFNTDDIICLSNTTFFIFSGAMFIIIMRQNIMHNIL
jgi:hypothetical protein